MCDVNEERLRFHKLNISRITEQALLSIVDYLESAKPINTSKCESISQQLTWAGSSAWHERLTCTPSILEQFEQWMLKIHSEKYAKDLMRYVKQYHDVLQHPNKAFQISVLPKDTRRLVMAGLANLSKFLGQYRHWKNIVENAGLKWEKKNSLDIVLDIMDTNLQDCWEWLREVLQKLPKDYGSVLVFIALTGLRPGEGVKSTRLISKLSEDKRVTDYLNEELFMLEHFRYGELFLRHCKNAYISFLTPELLTLVTTFKPRIQYSALDTKIGRIGLPVKVKELRKYWATTLRKHLPSEAIDLLQGRVGKSVFVRYYYKPFLKAVRRKVLRGIKPLQNELLEILD